MRQEDGAEGTPTTLIEHFHPRPQIDRTRAFVKENPTRQVSDVRRQLVYDRFLARLFSTADADRWVVKGSNALLFRLGGHARHTLDVDLALSGGRSLDEAEQVLRDAASTDLGDMFSFVVNPGSAVAKASRFNVDAFLGVTRFERFPVDLVVDVVMTDEPEIAAPALPDIPGMSRPGYRIYPVADHIADKVCAMYEVHAREAGGTVASTRFRDLADLWLIARGSTVDAGKLVVAIQSETRRRGMQLPGEVAIPHSPVWKAGYAALVRITSELRGTDIDQAVMVVGEMLNPILSGQLTSGSWNPTRLEWDVT